MGLKGMLDAFRDELNERKSPVPFVAPIIALSATRSAVLRSS